MHPPPDACVPRDAGITDAVALGASGQGTCVLRRDGRVSCWGIHGAGLGAAGTAAAPTDIHGVAGAIMLSTGEEHACAVRRDGRVLCWGDNRFGQLGDGTLEGRSTPVEVAGIDDAVEVAAGNRMFTCARRRTGRVSCWGGTERIPRSPPPRMVTLPVEDAAQIAAGPDHACLRRAGGEVLCFGVNRHGQFGVAPRAQIDTPTIVAP
jgi:alpha-tubulin suppressor-like RCC1 family protein